jgi:cellulose synthase/poly-beta-1,6-N-acetylglucosamine synthase-like glycosyltransferase
MMDLLLVGMLSAIAYTYVGYPLILVVLGRSRVRGVPQAALPTVSLVVSVYNGERIIQRKLENCAKLDYPQDKLEVIVASDCSSDGTHDIVTRFAHPRLRLVASPTRLGKEAAQKRAAEAATGEIVVFTDAGILVDPPTIRYLVTHFSDDRIGCVTGEDRVINQDGDVVGEGAYVRYETWLRRLESRFNSVVGMSGWLFAVRKSLCGAWPSGFASDFYMLLHTVRAGYRGVCEPRAVGYSWVVPSHGQELRRKVRTITRGIAVLVEQRALLNPLAYPVFAWQLVSHKLLRWMVPVLLAGVFATSLALAPTHLLYQLLVAAQALFYGVALAGYSRASWRSSALVRMPYFFCMSNLAIVIAWWKYLRGERFVVWEPTTREGDRSRRVAATGERA